MTGLLGAKELWKASAPPKAKPFFWLALHNRLWMADRRKRHGLQEDDKCAFCDQRSETADHLFASCVFSRETWCHAFRPLGILWAGPSADDGLVSWW